MNTSDDTLVMVILPPVPVVAVTFPLILLSVEAFTKLVKTCLAIPGLTTFPEVN